MKTKMTQSSWKLMACSLTLLLAVQNIQTSSALLYIVRQNCIRGSVFTPAPALVNNVCLQCLCVMADISYCKPLIVQLSVTCSAAIVVTAPLATVASPTIPTIPTTTLGINPRASSSAPAAGTMMMAAVPAMGSGNAPVMMMVPMMMAAGMTAAGMMASAPAPAPASATPAPAGR